MPVRGTYYIKNNGLNRNILECKLKRFEDLKKQYPVLIETYWNVNEMKEKVQQEIASS